MAPTCSEVDLLIIGAGPAGVMAALCAASYGIDARIIDKRPQKLEVGFGDGIFTRTLEILDTFGLAGALLEAGSPFAGFLQWERHGETLKQTAEIPPPRLPSHCYPIALSSFKIIEKMLEQIHEKSNIRVERGRMPESLEVDDTDPIYPVRVTVRTVKNEACETERHNNIRIDDDKDVLRQTRDRDTETIRAKYVIGCDGAHSWTRRQLHIPMEGDDSDLIWGVCDVRPITDFPAIRNPFTISSTDSASGGFLNIPRERGLVRMYTLLGSAESDENGKMIRSSITEQVIREAIQKALRPYKFDYKQIEWWAAYQIGQRVAKNNMFKKRVFLAGDAVHTHSPQAGQGLNVSMADTYNLLWKLNLVLKGVAKSDILDTYRTERLSIAQQLIDYGMYRKYATLMSGRPIEGTPPGPYGVREHLHRMFLESSAIYNSFHIVYRPSLVMGSLDAEIEAAQHYINESALPPGLVTGMRMPTHPVRHHMTGWESQLAKVYSSNGKFKLIVFAGDISQSHVLRRYQTLGAKIEQFQAKFAASNRGSPVEVFTVHRAGPDNVPLLDLPDVFHPFDEERGWDYDKVYYDGPNRPGFKPGEFERGSSAYEYFGISVDSGLLLVLRPDGYIAWQGALDDFESVENFFTGFLVAEV